MFTEDDQRSRSHGLARAVLEAQAAAMGVPLLSTAASWDEYEIAFVGLLREAGRTVRRRPSSATSTFRGIVSGKKTFAARLA